MRRIEEKQIIITELITISCLVLSSVFIDLCNERIDDWKNQIIRQQDTHNSIFIALASVDNDYHNDQLTYLMIMIAQNLGQKINASILDDSLARTGGNINDDSILTKLNNLSVDNNDKYKENKIPLLNYLIKNYDISFAQYKETVLIHRKESEYLDALMATTPKIKILGLKIDVILIENFLNFIRFLSILIIFYFYYQLYKAINERIKDQNNT